MSFDLHDPARLMFALVPDVVVVVGAMVVLLYAIWRPESPRHATHVALLAMAVAIAGLAAVVWATTAVPADSVGSIATDMFRWGADAVILIAATLTLAVSRDHNERLGVPAAEPAALILFAASGMMLLAAARDLILVFLGIEVMSVAVYVLAGIDRRSARAAEASLKYFLLGAFSTGFLLYGIALIYGATGSTLLPEIGRKIADPAVAASPMMLLGLALVLVGFAFKVAAVPFHMWTPDVYDGAPTPFSGFMATAVKAGAFAALVRICLEAVAPGMERWHDAVWWLAAVTMIAGNLFAIQQRNVKRLLAYSSIAHAGFLLVAVVAQTPAGAAAVLFYLAAYTFATIGAFAVVSTIGEDQAGVSDLGAYEGLWQVRPGLAMAMAVFMLALLGFPLAGGMGFFAKWYVLQAALQAPVPQTKLAIVLVLTTVVSASFYLYVVMVMFMRERPDDAPAPRRAGWLTQGVVGVAVTVILVLGLFPSPVVRMARQSTAASFPGRMPTAPAAKLAIQ